MENQWLQAALWMGLALAATLLSLRIAISIALLEIMVGVIGGNFFPLQRTEQVLKKHSILNLTKSQNWFRRCKAS